MFRIYADVAVLAVRRSARAWMAALSIPIYGAIFVGAVFLVQPLGIVGGILAALVAMACFAGYLRLIADAVAGNPIQFGDIRRGMRGLWDVCSVAFALMILGFGVSLVMTAAGPKGPAVAGVAQLAGAVFFNAVPELIYNGRNRSFALLKESFDFVTKNAFAWFFPNLLFALVLLAATGLLRFAHLGELLTRLAALGSPAGLAAALAAAPLWALPPLILLIHYVMVFRGLLFQELTTGNPRMRAFQRRMEG